MTRTELLDLARQVLNLPTAPYHEHEVYRFIQRFCQSHGLVAEPDRVGNLVVRYRLRRQHAPLVMVAHMDHPGFELVAGSQAEFLGGVPPELFREATVRFYPQGGTPIRKRVRSVDRRSWPTQKRVRLTDGRGLQAGDFGLWDLPPARVRAGRLFGAAIDDLLSVAVTLATLAELKRRRRPVHAWGVFTRAEEVGALGARALAAQGRLPRSAAVISMEMSRERPWARIGRGPVVRLGDRLSTFDPAVAGFLVATAEQLALAAADAGQRFSWQRALMDGGICEATMFGALGYRTAGLCLPLGNYHNIGRGNRPRLEYVSVDDLESLLQLTVAAAAAWRGLAPAARLNSQRLQRAWRPPSRRLAALESAG